MKKITILLAFFIAFGQFVSLAQQKELTIEDAVIGQWRQLSPDDLAGLCWRGSTHNFVYVKNYTQLFMSGVESEEQEIILTVEEINNALEEAGYESIDHIPYYNYKWLSDNLLKFTLGTRLIVFDVENKKPEVVIECGEGAENIDYCHTLKKVAFTKDNNLYIADEESNITAITDSKDIGIVSGNSYVHRQEFGIDDGIFWSPDGNAMAFYRKDETMVTDYPLVNITTRIAGLENSKYPMAGMKSEEVTLAVYNMSSGKTHFLKTGEPKEQYLTNISWSPDEKFIYIAVLNRGQNHNKLNKYDAQSGELVKTLFEEKHDKYVEPEEPVIFFPSNPDEFLWFSERDGYNHLYHYTTDGELIGQVTKGEWVVTDFLGFDEKEKNIFIEATAESPIERHIYEVNIKSGKMKKLTEAPGMHSAEISADREYILDSYSNTETPKVINLLNSKGKIERELLRSDNPLKDYKMGEMEIFKIKSADNKTDLYARLIKPANFNPDKKYPAIIYVYGGPHAQLIQNSWLGGARMWNFYMAQKGYVMLTIDNRGSANRGLQFENIIHRKLGYHEMQDQMKGVEYLKKLDYVDNDRIGLHGWSYGGFMTISLLLNYPDDFKVGVAGGPVTDWKYYEVMYGERYMDTPQENPQGYKETSLLDKVTNLQAKLLIVHGGVDPVVVMQNSLSFMRSCIKNGVQVDFFMYPTHEHNVRGKDRVHLMEKVTMYFDDYL